MCNYNHSIIKYELLWHGQRLRMASSRFVYSNWWLRGWITRWLGNSLQAVLLGTSPLEVMKPILGLAWSWSWAKTFYRKIDQGTTRFVPLPLARKEDKWFSSCVLCKSLWWKMIQSKRNRMFGLAGLRTISRSYHDTIVPRIQRREEPISTQQRWHPSCGTISRNIFPPQSTFGPGMSCRQCVSFV